MTEPLGHHRAYDVPHEVVRRHHPVLRAPVQDAESTLYANMTKHLHRKARTGPAVQSGFVHHTGSAGSNIVPGPGEPPTCEKLLNWEFCGRIFGLQDVRDLNRLSGLELCA